MTLRSCEMEFLLPFHDDEVDLKHRRSKQFVMEWHFLGSKGRSLRPKAESGEGFLRRGQ